MRQTIAIAFLALGVVAGGIYYFYYASEAPVPISEDLGVPVYPNAYPRETDSFATRLSPQDRAKLVRAVVFHTDDPPGLVISYYREQLGGDTRVFETKTGGLPSAVFQTQEEGKQRIIIISADEDSGKTEILVGMQKPQEQ